MKIKKMKKVALGILLITASILVSVQKDNQPSSKEEGIDFVDISFSEALKSAKVSNKLVFLDAYATWCGPCKWMDANTFKDESVGAYFNENFINLKMDMEKGEGPQIARRYKVTAYPTMFFINGEGEVIHKVLGAKPAKDFLKEAKKANG